MALEKPSEAERPASAISDEITSRLSHEFAARGACALRGLLQRHEVELLRSDCAVHAGDKSTADLLAADCVVEVMPPVAEGSPARTSRDAYLELRATDESRANLEAIIFHKLPAAVAAATNAPPSDDDPILQLFNEHMVLKPAVEGRAFRWHTDAAHQLEAVLALSPPDSLPDYVSVWVALDHIGPTNGALVLLPRDAPQPGHAPWHEPASLSTERWLNDAPALLTTSGFRPGDALIFSSRLWHASEPNGSDAPRRAYYAQYASQRIEARPSSAGAGGKRSDAAVPGAPLAFAVPAGRCHLRNLDLPDGAQCLALAPSRRRPGRHGDEDQEVGAGAGSAATTIPDQRHDGRPLKQGELLRVSSSPCLKRSRGDGTMPTLGDDDHTGGEESHNQIKCR